MRQKGKIEEFQKAKSPVVIRVRKGTMDNINDDNLISMKPLRKAQNLRRALSPTSGTETFLILNTNNSWLPELKEMKNYSKIMSQNAKRVISPQPKTSALSNRRISVSKRPNSRDNSMKRQAMFETFLHKVCLF